MGKNFKRKFINNKILNFHHTILTFHHTYCIRAILSHEIQTPIPGARSNGIRNDQMQVNPHPTLNIFSILILIFNGVFLSLEYPYLGIQAHVGHRSSSHI